VAGRIRKKLRCEETAIVNRRVDNGTLACCQGEAGFALITVIWSLGLISVLILAFTLNVRTQTKVAIASLSAATLEAAADAGLYLAIRDLVNSARRSSVKPKFPLNGMPVVCRIFDNIVLEISVQDEEGKVALNAAGEALLRALIEGLSVSPQDAARYADVLIDYRDPDELRRLNGAEASDYRQAGVDWLPSNGPYLTVDELNRVLGLPTPVADQLKPLVTVHSNRGGIDPQLAPPAVIDALTHGKTLGPAFAIASSRRFFAIRVTAWREKGATFTRLATAELTSHAKLPYKLLEWRRGHVTLSDHVPTAPSANENLLAY
jgi:type II secretory pathway component PulK